jgi:hypothetical protein
MVSRIVFMLVPQDQLARRLRPAFAPVLAHLAAKSHARLRLAPAPAGVST